MIKKTGKTTSRHKKLYVLDTNVLIHDPKSLFAFEGTSVGIPIIALEELDGFKREGTDRGRNSREVIRILDSLREKGSLRDGVTLENGTIVRVLFSTDEIHKPSDFSYDNADNRILFIAHDLQLQGYDVYFISKDLNARVKADILGLKTEDYLKEYVSQDNFYHGWITLSVPAVELKRKVPDALEDIKKELVPNEYILLESQHNPHNYTIYRYLGSGKEPFKTVHTQHLPWPLAPRNPQQIMAMDLLLDDSIKFVSLFGPAGTGKTFLALLAGLYKVLMQDAYEKMLVSRPVIPLGRDIGYLPGTMEEKLHNWMMPIYDNIKYILHTIQTTKQTHDQESQYPHHEYGYQADEHDIEHIHAHKEDKYSHQRKHKNDAEYKKSHKKKKKHHHKHHHSTRHDSRNLTLEQLLQSGKMELEAITYMRGRSIPFQYILIDETQNLTPHEIKTLVTRVGEGSKIIIAGDPYQIDSPYLDFSSNGLVVASERFKGEPLFGTVFLETSERSLLSQLASDLL